MQALAGVLFHVEASDADSLRTIRRFDFQPAVLGNGLIELRNLVALGQVRIKVILARKNRSLPNLAVQRHRSQDGVFNSLLVEYRKRSRQAEADGANVGVGLVAKARRAGTENLGV